GAGLFVIRRLNVRRITTWRTTIRFAVAAAISPALFGAIFAGLLMAGMGGNGVAGALQWFLANFLAVCIIFPLGMTISLRRMAKLKLGRRIPEALLVLALSAVAGWL